MSFSTVGFTVVGKNSDSEKYLDNSANTLVRPKSAKGISGFVFDVPESENISLTSEITDHYTENNSFINDHVVKKPVIITLSGFVGELVFTLPEGIEGAVQELSNRLETVEAYLGDLTPGFVQDAQKVVGVAETVISSVNQTIDRIQNVVDFFEGEGPEETLQQKAFNNLYSLWGSSNLVTVQTPWRYFDNMQIKDIGFSQDSETKEITNIVVTLKEMRFAEIEKTDFDNYVNAPRVEMQETESEDIGKIQGRTESFLYTVSESI